MNCTENLTCITAVKPSVSIRGTIRLALGLCLGLLLSAQTFAQYGSGGGGTGGAPGSPGYVPPKGGYGSGKAIGIGVGAAAVGAGALFFTLHHHHRAVSGCVHRTDDGLSIVDEKKNKSYSVAPGSIDLQPGRRLELAGKKSSGTSGTEIFQATKLVKDLGACSAQSPVDTARQ